MFCGRCGNKLDDDDLFCRECGEPVPMQARAQQAARAQNRTAALAAASESTTAAAGSDMNVAANNTAAAAKNTVKDRAPAGNAADRTDWAGLVERFKNGTEAQKSDAFTALYDASYKKVYAHVQKYARNEEKSSDAVQNAYIKCWNNIGQLEDGARFLPWMKQIAYNEFLLMLRKDNKLTDFGAVTDDEGNETPAEDFLADDTLPMPEDAYANEELHRLLLESIDALSEGQRVVLKGFYFDSKPVQTLAEELGVPVNTVKTHLSRGRKNLAARVSAYANAYGLKLVPLAVLPLMAELGKKDAYACEVSATVAGAAQVIAAAQKAVAAAGATSTAAAGSAGAAGTTVNAAGTAAQTAAGTAAKTAVETAATGAGGTAVGGSSAAAASAGAASAGQAAGTAAAAGSSFAVKAGIGLTVVAVAAGGGGAYAYHQATTPEVIEEPAVVEEPMEEIERIPDGQRMSAMYESIQETYGIVSDSSMTSPCWLVQEGTTLDIAFTSSGADGKEYPLFVTGEEDSYEGILRTGTYDGESGAYAIYEKDLDRDGDQELIAFIRTQDYAEGDPHPARNDWHFELVVYDVEDGILLSTDPQEINTIQFGDDVSDAADMRGLIVYYKEAADADEILCYRYQTLTYCFDGYWYYYNLTGYTYRDGQLQMVASVGRDYLEGAYSNGQYNPVGANTSQEEQIAGLRALGLDRSADVTADGTFDAFDERYALQEDGVLDEDNTFYLRQEMISRDEPDIEYLFEYYPVDHVEMEDWTNVDFDYVIQQYDISTWSFEQKLRIYDTEDLVDEVPAAAEAPNESESTQTNETEENP